MVKRFEVHLISLGPTIEREIKKIRPCVVVSPNEIHILDTVTIAPMTTKSKPYPMRVPVTFGKKDGFIVLDQIRTIDKTRLIKCLGSIDKNTSIKTLKVLREIFEY